MTEEFNPDWACKPGCVAASALKEHLAARADLAQPPVSDAEAYRIESREYEHGGYQPVFIVGTQEFNIGMQMDTSEESNFVVNMFAKAMQRALQSQAVPDRKEIRQFIASAVCGYDRDREILNTHPHLYNQRIERLTDDLFSILDSAPVNKPVEGLKEAISNVTEPPADNGSEEGHHWKDDDFWKVVEAARRYMKLSENGAPEDDRQALITRYLEALKLHRLVMPGTTGQFTPDDFRAWENHKSYLLNQLWNAVTYHKSDRVAEPEPFIAKITEGSHE